MGDVSAPVTGKAAIGKVIADIVRGSEGGKSQYELICEAASGWIRMKCRYSFGKRELWKSGRDFNSFVNDVKGELVIKIAELGWGDILTEDCIRKRLNGFIENSINDVLNPERKWRRQRRLTEQAAEKGRIDADEAQMMPADKRFWDTQDASNKRQALEDCLRRLEKTTWQKVVDLKDKELTFKQIAARLKVTVDTVQGWWRRAKEHLERCLNEKLNRSDS